MPDLHKALIDAHLVDARASAQEMREHLQAQITDVFTRFTMLQADLLVQAYAQGVRDGYVQGVGAAAKELPSGPATKEDNDA